MRFGFSLPGRGPLARPDVLVKLAERADALRYASVFVTDHVVIPSTYSSTYPLPKRAKPGVGDHIPFRGAAAEVIQDIRDYQAVGVTHFIFDLAAQDLRGQLTAMDRFAEEIRPRVLRAPR